MDGEGEDRGYKRGWQLSQEELSNGETVLKFLEDSWQTGIEISFTMPGLILRTPPPELSREVEPPTNYKSESSLLHHRYKLSMQALNNTSARLPPQIRVAEPHAQQLAESTERPDSISDIAELRQRLDEVERRTSTIERLLFGRR